MTDTTDVCLAHTHTICQIQQFTLTDNIHNISLCTDNKSAVKMQITFTALPQHKSPYMLQIGTKIHLRYYAHMWVNNASCCRNTKIGGQSHTFVINTIRTMQCVCTTNTILSSANTAWIIPRLEVVLYIYTCVTNFLNSFCLLIPLNRITI